MKSTILQKRSEATGLVWIVFEVRTQHIYDSDYDIEVFETGEVSIENKDDESSIIGIQSTEALAEFIEVSQAACQGYLHCLDLYNQQLMEEEKNV